MTDLKSYYENLYKKTTWGVDDKFRTGRFGTIFSLLAKNIEGDKLAILDFGAGDGAFSNLLNVNQKYYYLDLASAVHKKNINTSIKSEIINFDYTNHIISLQDKTMDVVIMSEVIEHLTEPDKDLKEINRVLKDGGSIIISTPNAFSLSYIMKSLFGKYIDPSKEHVSLYDWSTLNNLMEINGFKQKEKKLLWFSCKTFNKFPKLDHLLSKIFNHNCIQLIVLFTKK